MSATRLVITTTLVAGIVLVGAIAGCGPASGPTGSDLTTRESPSSLSHSGPSNTPSPEPRATPTREPADDPSASQTPTLPERPARQEKPVGPSGSSTGLPETFTGSAGSEPASSAAAQGRVYTYRDGDRTIRVLLQPDLVVQKTADNIPDDVVAFKGARDSIVQRRTKHGRASLPVFRSESGGGLMTLPGGVLLALDPGWDQTGVDNFFSRNQIPMDRVSELGYLENGFLVETEPGFASLELANALAAQDGVVIASPNWWSEVEAK